MNMSNFNLPGSRLPVLDPLDQRLNAYRTDLADERLRGKIEAEEFVEGDAGRVVVPIADLKASANADNNTAHQLLLGEEVLIFERSKDWVWVQSKRDGYVGYAAGHCVEAVSSAPVSSHITSHIVCVPLTFRYPHAELREPPQSCLSMGSRLTVIAHEIVRGTKYAMLEDGGSIIEKHLRKVDDHDTDYIKICEQLLHTPYLWGGASGFGIDCSGLIQLAMRLCGQEVLRDSDMQAATLGEEIDPGNNLENLQRGDLIFWRGHVAIHKGTIHTIPHIIHASGHTMTVAIEPLHEAMERIAYLYEGPIGFRRPYANGS